ncbi:hypothetical protein [Streptomyces sp. NPDC014734]|uniref:hypothetical protein n=1 Tax=Streptomyces sp. NPDC014734 TaxID=3364886 RepID=UPI0036F743B6
MVPDSVGPVATGPADGNGVAPTGPQALSVRVPRPPRPAPAPAARTGESDGTARTVQRAAARAGITGVPVRAAPVKPSESPGRAAPPAPAAAARVTAADIEELARRLLDPVSRLIRADMRRGRERAGRLYDGRR